MGYQDSIKFRFNRIVNPNKLTIITSWIKSFFGIKSITSTAYYDPKEYNVGEKIGQLIIIPYPKVEWNEVNEFMKSDRGLNGFGSTDNTTEVEVSTTIEPAPIAEEPKKKSRKRKKKE